MRISHDAIQKPNWTPLLDGIARREALTSIREISTSLAATFEAEYRASIEGQEISPNAEPYLGTGAAGIALFFAYLRASGLYNPTLDLSSDYLAFAIEAAATRLMGPSLYNGFTGIAWAAQHISQLQGGVSDDVDEDVDNILYKYLCKSPWIEDYDLINGLAGLALYCLERSESPIAKHSLEIIVEHLSELAVRSQDVVAWFHHVNLFVNNKQRETYPNGYYNLGLAHGAAGVIALLGRIHACGIAQEQTGWLAERAARWLLQQRLPAGFRSWFPGLIDGNKVPVDCRLAWCHGDAGIAAGLLTVARCVGSNVLADEALAVARHAAMREPATAGVEDCCFCHGSSGLAHTFNRIYHATGDELFADASRFWFERTLQFREPGNGAAGYSVWIPNDEGQRGIVQSANIIDGIAGVGLALIAAITDVQPNWDRIFLLDIPNT